MAGISALSPRRGSSGGSALDGFFDAQNSAMDSVDRFSAKRASNRAGQAMKARDYSGAADEFYDAGLLGEGSEVQNYGQAQEDRASKIDAETVKKRGTFLVDLARGLKNVAPAERNAQFERFAPALKSLGADDEMIGQLRNAPKDDAALDMFAGGVEQQLVEFIKSGDGSYTAASKKTGRPLYQYEAPTPDKYEQVDPEKNLTLIPGSPGSTAAPTPAPAPTSSANPSAVIAALTGAGARVTSARRSPERNAAVGGAPNSYHLTDRARDIVPPPGMSMAQLEQRLRSSGADFVELINEGDHIHVAWAGEGSGPGSRTPKVVMPGRPKAKDQSRPATEAEKAVYGIPSNTPAQIKPDGSIDVIALPKGTADLEKEQMALDAQVLKAKDIIGLARTARNDVSGFSAGTIGGNLSGIKGAPAYNLERNIDTIKANLGFQELQAMRQASPTGGALGAIAVQELNALQSTVASLDTGQSPEQLRQNLSKIERHYQRWIDAVSGKRAADAKRPAPPASLKAAPAPVLQSARAAIKAGADRTAVIKRMRENGFDTKGL